MNNKYELLTRLIDIFTALFFILLLSPVFIIIIILLKFTGQGEVFYFQQRVGKNKNIFNVIKFATMLKESPNIGAGGITLTDDPRVLPVGKFLRKSKINELPQVFNIFNGEMSFVGPRPLMLKQYSFYTESQQKIIKKMRPGLTGIGSIVFRDEEKFFKLHTDPDHVYKSTIAPAKGLLEIWFWKNRSLLLYFRIIFLTAKVVIHPKTSPTHLLDTTTNGKLNEILSKS